MVDVKEVAENIYMIDDELLSMPKWGSVYLINEEEKALIDTGPSSSANAVLGGIKKIGIKSEDIEYLIVTHIHLDHAGGVGVLVKDMPQAQVVVHNRGARHLVDPSRLISSVKTVQSSEVIEGYGEVVPIEKRRVRPIYGDEVVRLSSKQILKFIDAPGHAQHELCIYESRNNGIFVGDAAGIFVAEDEILVPSSPPPNFDLELHIGTLERLMDLKPSLIYFAHFGVSNQAQEHLRLIKDKVRAWGDIVAQTVKEHGLDGVEERIIAQVTTELEPIREKEFLYEHLTKDNIATSISGYLKYYRDKYGVE